MITFLTIYFVIGIICTTVIILTEQTEYITDITNNYIGFFSSLAWPYIIYKVIEDRYKGLK